MAIFVCNYSFVCQTCTKQVHGRSPCSSVNRLTRQIQCQECANIPPDDYWHLLEISRAKEKQAANEDSVHAVDAKLKDGSNSVRISDDESTVVSSSTTAAGTTSQFVLHQSERGQEKNGIAVMYVGPSEGLTSPDTLCPFFPQDVHMTGTDNIGARGQDVVASTAGDDCINADGIVGNDNNVHGPVTSSLSPNADGQDCNQNRKDMIEVEFRSRGAVEEESTAGIQITAGTDISAVPGSGCHSDDTNDIGVLANVALQKAAEDSDIMGKKAEEEDETEVENSENENEGDYVYESDLDVSPLFPDYDGSKQEFFWPQVAVVPDDFGGKTIQWTEDIPAGTLIPICGLECSLDEHNTYRCKERNICGVDDNSLYTLSSHLNSKLFSKKKTVCGSRLHSPSSQGIGSRGTTLWAMLNHSTRPNCVYWCNMLWTLTNQAAGSIPTVDYGYGTNGYESRGMGPQCVRNSDDDKWFENTCGHTYTALKKKVQEMRHLIYKGQDPKNRIYRVVQALHTFTGAEWFEKKAEVLPQTPLKTHSLQTISISLFDVVFDHKKGGYVWANLEAEYDCRLKCRGLRVSMKRASKYTGLPIMGAVHAGSCGSLYEHKYVPEGNIWPSGTICGWQEHGPMCNGIACGGLAAWGLINESATPNCVKIGNVIWLLDDLEPGTFLSLNYNVTDSIRQEHGYELVVPQGTAAVKAFGRCDDYLAGYLQQYVDDMFSVDNHIGILLEQFMWLDSMVHKKQAVWIPRMSMPEYAMRMWLENRFYDGPREAEFGDTNQTWTCVCAEEVCHRHQCPVTEQHMYMTGGRTKNSCTEICPDCVIRLRSPYGPPLYPIASRQKTKHALSQLPSPKESVINKSPEKSPRKVLSVDTKDEGKPVRRQKHTGETFLMETGNFKAYASLTVAGDNHTYQRGDVTAYGTVEVVGSISRVERQHLREDFVVIVAVKHLMNAGSKHEPKYVMIPAWLYGKVEAEKGGTRYKNKNQRDTATTLWCNKNKEYLASCTVKNKPKFVRDFEHGHGLPVADIAVMEKTKKSRGGVKVPALKRKSLEDHEDVLAAMECGANARLYACTVDCEHLVRKLPPLDADGEGKQEDFALRDKVSEMLRCRRCGTDNEPISYTKQVQRSFYPECYIYSCRC